MIATLTPLDTLCICDAKPKRAGDSYGIGARLPLGPTFHGGIRTTLLDHLQTQGKTEKGKNGKIIGSRAFNWLGVKGPLPYLENEGKLLFPTPQDLYLTQSGIKMLQWEAPAGEGEPNFPILGKRKGTPSKDEIPQWMDEDALELYIQGKTPHKLAAHHLFKKEYKIGVKLLEDKTTEEGMLYGVVHARLLENIKLKAEILGTEKAKEEEMEQLKSTPIIRIGGETRACYFNLQDGRLPIPSPKPEGTWIKWILLSPAIFLKGNIPDFIGPNGEILLQSGTRTKNRKQENSQPIEGTLKGICLGKPETMSLYDIVLRKSKAVYQAIPAGSVYLFKTSNPEALIKALHNRCLSSVLGEKGLGWGICANHKP